MKKAITFFFCICFLFCTLNSQNFKQTKFNPLLLEELSADSTRLSIDLNIPCLFPNFTFFQDTSDTDPIRNSFVNPDPLLLPTNFRIFFSYDRNRWQITGSDTSIIFFYSEFLSSPNPPNNNIGEWKNGPLAAQSGCGTENELAGNLEISGEGTQGELEFCSFQVICLPGPINLQLDENGLASLTVDEVLDPNTELCGGILSLERTNFDCSDVGEMDLLVIASDTLGHSDTCIIKISIEDRIAPTAKCQNMDIFLDSAGSATLLPTSFDDGSTDNCSSDLQLTASQTSFNCSDLGDQEITLMLEDESGNTSSCTAKINVKDTIAPRVICKQAMVRLSSTGEGTLNVSDINNGSEDACGLSTLQIDQSNFNCSDLGTTIVSLMAIDSSGNKDTCQVRVEIVDEFSPNALCKDLTIILDDSGSATVVADSLDDGSTDNCSISTLEASMTSFDQNNIGPNLVSLVVKDPSGNRDSCLATVTVLDNIPPVAKCQTATIYLEDNGFAELDPSAVNKGSFDASGDISLQLDQTEFGCFHVPRYNMVTLTVIDIAGNQSTCKALVRVIDKSPLPAPFETFSICQSRGTSYYEQCKGGIVVQSQKTSYPFSGTQDWSQFTYTPIRGDFSLKVRTSRITDFAVAGVMIRSSLANNAIMAYAGISTYDQGKLEVGSRTGPNQKDPLVNLFSGTNNHFSIERRGNTIRIFNGENEVWSQHWSEESLLVGFFVSSKGGWAVDAYFDEISLDEIGTPYCFNMLEERMPYRSAHTPIPLLKPGAIQLPSAIARVYPNPASGDINIYLPEFSGEDLNITLYHMSGRLVRQFTYRKVEQTLIQLDVTGIQAGIYLVKIRSPREERVFKISLQ